MPDETRKIKLPKQLVEEETSKLKGEVTFNLHHSTICQILSTYLSGHTFKYPVVVTNLRVEMDETGETRKRMFYVDLVDEDTYGCAFIGTQDEYDERGDPFDDEHMDRPVTVGEVFNAEDETEGIDRREAERRRRDEDDDISF